MTATKARFKTVCPSCKGVISAGSPIKLLDGGWGHPKCATKRTSVPSNASIVREFERNKARVESGETFRSQAPSSWSRKTRRGDAK